jgi:hypothetical protein
VSVLEELSPYCFHGVGAANPPQGWWMWGVVVDILRRYEQTGIPQPELPRAIQRPGAIVGLAVGLAVRQAALAAQATH